MPTCFVGIFESLSRFQQEEAEALTQRALEAGMHGDNASGNALNLVIMTKEGTVFKGPIVPDFCLKPESKYVVHS